MKETLTLPLQKGRYYVQRSGHIVGPLDHAPDTLGRFCFYADHEKRPKLQVEIWDKNGISIEERPDDDIAAVWKPEPAAQWLERTLERKAPKTGA